MKINQTYYTPESPKPQTASVGEFRQIQMEDDAIIRRVSRDLYASPASGVRELLANEIRAAILAKQQGANPRIEVTIQDNMIRIWGIDSLGMEREIFETVFSTLGRSSNFDGKTPGQFGLGRAAYVTISDHMLLETNCRNGDRYSVLGVEGRGYQTGLPGPDIPYGTRVTMAPREQTAGEMEEMVRRTASRSPIPITLITDQGAEDLQFQPLARNDHLLAADLPEVEFATGAGRPFYRYYNNRGHSDVEAFLCGMPIKYVYRGKYNLQNTVLDIHDERKFPPTPDRERMTEQAERDISEVIDCEIKRRLDKFPRNINEALNHPDRLLVFKLETDDPHTRPLYEKVKEYFDRNEDGKMLFTMKPLGEVDGDPVLNCTAFLPRQIEAVKVVYPNTKFVKGAPSLINITDFMRQHGIKPIPTTRQPKPKNTKIVIHTCRGSRRIDPGEETEYMIYKVDDGKDLKKYDRVLVEWRVALTIHNCPQAINLGKAMTIARKRKYETSAGVMTGAQLINSGKRVYGTQSKSLVGVWGDGTDKNEPSILVLAEDRRAYTELCMQSRKLETNLGGAKFAGDGQHVMKTYLRLDNPVLKRVLDECPTARTPQFCDDFLKMDGKDPVPHDDYCHCRRCGGARPY